MHVSTYTARIRRNQVPKHQIGMNKAYFSKSQVTCNMVFPELFRHAYQLILELWIYRNRQVLLCYASSKIYSTISSLYEEFCDYEYARVTNTIRRTNS